LARGRLISKSLGSSRKFHELLRLGRKLGEFCQVLFPLIIANTDDFGRMSGDAFTVKNAVLPTSQRPEADFERALQVMQEAGLITRYALDGGIYLQVNKFDEHQINLTRRTKSKFPEVPADDMKLPLNLTELKRTELKGTDTNGAAREADRLFDLFWAAYPKKKAKEDARRAWDKRRPDAALLQVILRSLQQQCQSSEWLNESGRYIPFPATWLNRGQWTDEPLELPGPKLYEPWCCPHEIECGSPTICRNATVLNRPLKVKAS
jgi:hypothetical protein